MNIDSWTLEKAAFACFQNKLEDNFKRLLFLNIQRLVKSNPNVTANRCFGMLQDAMAVERIDFDAAVRALETPFKIIAINKYTRASRRTGGNPAVTAVDIPPNRQVMHLVPLESEAWVKWCEDVTTEYPELSIWITG